MNTGLVTAGSVLAILGSLVAGVSAIMTIIFGSLSEHYVREAWEIGEGEKQRALEIKADSFGKKAKFFTSLGIPSLLLAALGAILIVVACQCGC